LGLLAVDVGFFVGATVVGRGRADGRGGVAAGVVAGVDGVILSATSCDWPAVVAFFWCAMTGTATATTASPAATSAANHDFLKSPSG